MSHEANLDRVVGVWDSLRYATEVYPDDYERGRRQAEDDIKRALDEVLHYWEDD